MKTPAQFPASLNLPCGSLFRLYLCLHIIVGNVIAMTDPGSVAYRLTAAAGTEGWAVMMVMTMAAALGVLDGIVNDVMPDHYTFGWGLNFRHMVYMAIPICYAVQMWFSISVRSYTEIPFYTLQIMFLVLAAFLDVRERFHPQAKKESGAVCLKGF